MSNDNFHKFTTKIFAVIIKDLTGPFIYQERYILFCSLVYSFTSLVYFFNKARNYYCSYSS